MVLAAAGYMEKAPALFGIFSGSTLDQSPVTENILNDEWLDKTERADGSLNRNNKPLFGLCQGKLHQNDFPEIHLVYPNLTEVCLPILKSSPALVGYSLKNQIDRHEIVVLRLKHLGTKAFNLSLGPCICGEWAILN
jgi:hypothetical protein